MPSGAYVEAYLFGWRTGMNVYVTVPPKLFNKTKGLCGVYDHSKTNDYTFRDGRVLGDASQHTYAHINNFIESWRSVSFILTNFKILNEISLLILNFYRITKEESLFVKPPSNGHWLRNPSEYCQCSEYGSKMCGFDAFENPSLKEGHPKLNASAAIPTWLSTGGRTKRAVHVVIADEVDDEYVILDYEETTAQGAPPSWPTPSGITEATAEAKCDVYLKDSAPYKACSGNIRPEDYRIILEKCKDDVKVGSGS